MKKALIAMSGGVDSSVAAYLMKQNEYFCVGCTMKLYDNEDAGVSKEHTCCSLDDVEDARSVAYKLGMAHHVFNFSDDFREKIIGKFVKSYAEGKTPNPCIDCNKYMKFGKLFERADILGCDVVVTGHYARIESANGEFMLKKALDPAKDQSYVLYFLTQEQLSRMCFPLGELCKSDVRRIAEENGFLNAEKPDSQDICFVPDGDYAKVVEMHSGKTFEDGDFIDKSGNIIGRHHGIIRYTVGQRRGLGISASDRIYVTAVDPERNTVTLGSDDDLYRCDVEVSDVSFVSGKMPDAPFRCAAKIRYRQKEQPATVTPTENGFHITFDEPQRAVTAGQAAVLYDGDVVLGGGTIIR